MDLIVSLYILKICNTLFSEKLADIVNLVFKTGIFPDLCKLAKTIPIFKKDDPLLCVNYRPISLLPIFSKILERLIHKRMYSFLDVNKLIYNKQFGFRSNHSTSHALINTTEVIKEKLDSGFHVGGIFIDLEKAFDTVNHDLLIEKLYYYGFRGVSQQLIKSFLSDRHQYVSIQGFGSPQLPITCGVPQGSTLGPLLFLLYINDLNLSIKASTVSHFADDTSILYASKKSKTLESVLNYDLKLCVEWLKVNRLSLNVEKSKLLIFQTRNSITDYDNISIKLDGCKLFPAGHVKYLGLNLDKFLNWDCHVKLLSNKLSRANGVLCKLRNYAPKNILFNVYHSIFYSHMTYACPVWTLTKKMNIGLISILQRKCLRIINFAPFNSHTNDMFATDKILNFEDIISFEQLKVVFDFINNKLPDELNN